MAKEPPKYNVSADVVGHLQHMDDLPEVGTRVRVVGPGVAMIGQVFAHVPHPDTKNAAGWGFALIKLEHGNEAHGG